MTPLDLRGLLFCGRCGVELLAWAREGTRCYVCLCRDSVDAAEVEGQVWRRFARANEAYAEALPAQRRSAAIRLVVRRIRYGVLPGQVCFEWRD